MSPAGELADLHPRFRLGSAGGTAGRVRDRAASGIGRSAAGLPAGSGAR